MRAGLAVLLLLSGRVAAVTLSEIPALVTTRNDEVRAARKDVEASDDAVFAAKAKHLPSLHWKSNYIHLGSDIQLQVPTQTIGSLAITLPPVTLQKQEIFLSSLQATWPLFAGGRISAGVDGAEAQREEARATMTKAGQEKTREAIGRYFGAQLAKQVTTLLESMKGQLDRLRAISESLVKTGLGTRFAVLQIRVAQADLDSRLAEARGKAQLADLAFRTSIGADAAVTYESPLKKIPLKESLEELKKQAIETRSELAIVRAKAGQAQALKDYHAGTIVPSVAMVGARQLVTSNLPVLEPSWAVGVLIDIPLTQWIGGSAEMGRAVKLGEKAEIGRAHAEREIPLEVEKCYRESEATEAALAANDEGLALAREALRLAEVRFKSGDGSAVEVLRATTDLETAEIRSLRLTEELDAKLLDLYRAAGRVTRFVEAYEGVK